MNRRDVLATLGVTAAGLTALAGAASGAEEGHPHAECQGVCRVSDTVRLMLRTLRGTGRQGRQGPREIDAHLRRLCRVLQTGCDAVGSAKPLRRRRLRMLCEMLRPVRHGLWEVPR